MCKKCPSKEKIVTSGLCRKCAKVEVFRLMNLPLVTPCIIDYIEYCYLRNDIKSLSGENVLNFLD